MRKLLVILILLLILLPCISTSASDYALPVGPYTFNAEGCSLYNYYSGNYLIVQYALTEAYAGMGMGNAMVHLAYYTHDELGFSYDMLTESYGTDNNWQLASYMVDINYGKDSQNTVVMGCSADETEPCLSPAAALFTCPVSEEYGGGYMSGAVFVNEEGILFIESYILPGSAQTAQDYRRGMLGKLTYNGAPVITEVPDPDAAFLESSPETGTPVTVEMAGGYSFDVEGWEALDDSDDTSVYIQYYNKAVYVTYIPHPDDGGDPYDTAKYYYDRFYIEYNPVADWYEYTQIDYEGELPLKYSGVLKDEYGGGYMAGAIVVNGDDVLFIEINATNPETSWDDLDIYRGKLLRTFRLNGEAVIR